MARRGLVIVGCGWIARRHAAAARRLRIPLIFASREVTRAQAYAAEFGGSAAYGDYAAALADPSAAGAIICTPHDRHAADALLALAAGKHVLVEKPIARSLEEANRMIAAAAEAGRALMIAENVRFIPAFRHVRALAAGGRLGALRELTLVARGFRPRTGWRRDAVAMGGGALIDGGIHYVHLLRWWGGAVRRVFALSPPQALGGMGGEDAASLLAELDRGAVGYLCNSLGTPGISRFQWSTVTGSRATCFADNRGRLVVMRGTDGVGVWPFLRDTRGYAAMLQAFCDAMGRGQVDEMDGAAGRADLAVVLAAYRSIAERRPVEIVGPDGATC